ncbi:MAG: DNA methyltransferase [Rikenellaceae bacterium]
MYRRTISEDWDFKNSNTKEYTHCYHNYPAMMIPQVARKLIEEYFPEGELNLIFDPYVGSGTSLVEASIKGIDSIGTDINPLARFISKVKTTSFDLNLILKSKNLIISSLNRYNLEKHEIYNYDHITQAEYWYSKETLDKLMFISCAIKRYGNKQFDFFNLVLSESVRESSYTRNGEFKRYRMDMSKVIESNMDPIKLFISKLERNVIGLSEYMAFEKKGKATIYNFNTIKCIPKRYIVPCMVDMVVTSPPYGDSKTTVAYGQFSRWANEWFRFDNAKSVDNMLMGGVKKTKISFSTVSIAKELEQIKDIDKKRYIEVVSFLDDYYFSIKNVASVVRSGGRICYVVGNRNVKGIQIPLDFFTAEMFEKFGCVHENTIVRSIGNKRMPSRTCPTNIKGANIDTMSSEYIVIMTKK